MLQSSLICELEVRLSITALLYYFRLLKVSYILDCETSVHDVFLFMVWTDAHPLFCNGAWRWGFQGWNWEYGPWGMGDLVEYSKGHKKGIDIYLIPISSVHPLFPLLQQRLVMVRHELAACRCPCFGRLHATNLSLSTNGNGEFTSSPPKIHRLPPLQVSQSISSPSYATRPTSY